MARGRPSRATVYKHLKYQDAILRRTYLGNLSRLRSN